jgi:hypothetical protein
MPAVISAVRDVAAISLAFILASVADFALIIDNKRGWQWSEPATGRDRGFLR